LKEAALMTHTRREFLKRTSTLFALGASVPALLARSARAAASPAAGADTILVVVQLAGGNDGLNTVIPFEDDLYARARPTLRIAGNQVHKIDALLGFHPEMQGFARLFKEGTLSVVQGVGYPNPNDDHAWAMRDWQTARPHDRFCQTGWLGRTLDESDAAAALVAEIAPPVTLNAEKTIVPTIKSLKDGTFRVRPADGARVEGAASDRLLEFVRRTTAAADSWSARIDAAAQSAAAGTYPNNDLARMLKIVAQLIRADVGIRIYYTELGGESPGGFDNHSMQFHNHAALLKQLSASVAAFADDLARDKLLDRVLLMTFSEFGRTLAENGRHGTGHGSAAPMFLVGGRVKGGLVGATPGLAELENGGPKFHTDFRRVYATVLDRWLGFDSAAALGERFEHVDALRG
jgi:uncharacterized protein (DUF1501 family)